LRGLGPIFVWILALIVVVVVGGFAIMGLRHRLLGDEQESLDAPLSLDALRQMRAAGQISEEEYTRLRTVLLASMGYAEDGKKSGARAEGEGGVE
jgi:uncharacterized membrane protein